MKSAVFILMIFGYLFNQCSCKEKESYPVIDVEQVFFTGAVSSGSGICVRQGTAYIIGDDAAYIGALSISSRQYRQIPFEPGAAFTRMNRAVKYDLESAITGTWKHKDWLFAFGSGSRSPYRDSLFVLNLENKSEWYKFPLSRFYHAFALAAGLKAQEVNVEGSAIVGGRLVLFNRGRNMLVSCSWADFCRYLDHDFSDDHLPAVKTAQLSLPVINGYQVGLSGACDLDNDRILFTASLEETRSTIEDGAIKGSYIGIIKVDKNNRYTLQGLTALKDKNNKVIVDKLEAIDKISIQGNHMNALAVADNDNGLSRIFYLSIRL